MRVESAIAVGSTLHNAQKRVQGRAIGIPLQRIMERNHDLPSTLNYNGIAISLHWLIALFIDGGFYLGTSWQRSSIS